MVPKSPCSCTAVTSGESMVMGVQASVESCRLINMTDLVSFGFFRWFFGYSGIQVDPARVIPLKSTYGSCRAQMSKSRPKETSRSDCASSDLFAFCCQMRSRGCSGGCSTGIGYGCGDLACLRGWFLWGGVTPPSPSVPTGKWQWWLFVWPFWSVAPWYCAARSLAHLARWS